MAGYVRQSTAEILPSLVILADSFNKEFNAVQGAFNNTTGHTHDGTTGNGPKINLTTSVSGILPTANGGTGTGTLTTVDNTIARFNGTGGVLQASSVVISDTWAMSGMTQINLGVSNQAAALVRLRTAGQSIEFGHVNAAGYGSAIGAEDTSGIPYLAFNAERGTNVNTYLTRGIIGTVITPDQLGGFVFSKIATASADNQSKTTLATLSTAGVFATSSLTLTTALTVANGGTGVATHTAGFLVGNGTAALITRVPTGTANEITVTNGSGVAGNPTFSLPTALTFTGKTITGGAFNSGTIDNTVVGGTTKAAGSFTQVLATNGFVHTDGTHAGLFSAGSGKVIIGSTSAHPLDLLSNSTTVATFNTSGMTLPVNSAITFSGTGAATTRTNLGLGTMATQAASAVAITGGSFNGTVGATTPSTVVSTGITSTTLTVDGGGLSSFISKGLSAGTGINTLRFNDSANTLMGYVGFTGANTNLNLYNALGNVQILASNAVVSVFTSTGMNSTAVGATTPSTGAFTTLSTSSSSLFGGNVTVQDGFTIQVSPLGNIGLIAGTFSATGATTGKQMGQSAFDSSVNTTASTKHQRFYNPNGEVGSISTSASATAYTTSSDYRLKTDVQEFSGSGDLIDRLRPVSYTWIKGQTSDIGFIAHEVQEVFPSAVTGKKDQVDSEGNPSYQGGDWSKLVPVLVAELKALRIRVAELESKNG